MTSCTYYGCRLHVQLLIYVSINTKYNFISIYSTFKKCKALRNGHNYLFIEESRKRKIEIEENKQFELTRLIINLNKLFVKTKQHLYMIVMTKDKHDELYICHKCVAIKPDKESSRTLDDAPHYDTNTEINTSRYTCS